MSLTKKKIKFISTGGKSSNLTMRVIESLKDLKGYKEEFPEKYAIIHKILEKELRLGSKIIVNSNGGWQIQIMGVVEILN